MILGRSSFTKVGLLYFDVKLAKPVINNKLVFFVKKLFRFMNLQWLYYQFVFLLSHLETFDHIYCTVFKILSTYFRNAINSTSDLLLVFARTRSRHSLKGRFNVQSITQAELLRCSVHRERSKCGVDGEINEGTEVIYGLNSV